jgi:hypothetical protein
MPRLVHPLPNYLTNMKAIHKYPLAYTGENEIPMPLGAEIIHAGTDPKGALCVWAKVDLDQPEMEPWGIFVAGTGLGLPDYELHHLASCVCGSFVWHVFSRMNDQVEARRDGAPLPEKTSTPLPRTSC